MEEPKDLEKDGEINPAEIGKKFSFFHTGKVEKAIESPDLTAIEFKFKDAKEYKTFYRFIYKKSPQVLLKFNDSEEIIKIGEISTNKVKLHAYSQPMRNKNRFGKEPDEIFEIEAKSLSISKNAAGGFYLHYAFVLSDQSLILGLDNKWIVLELAHPDESIFLAPVDVTCRFKVGIVNSIPVFAHLLPAPSYDHILWLRSQQEGKLQTDSESEDDLVLSTARRKQEDIMFSDEENPYYDLAKRTMQQDDESDIEGELGTLRIR